MINQMLLHSENWTVYSLEPFQMSTEHKEHGTSKEHESSDSRLYRPI